MFLASKNNSKVKMTDAFAACYSNLCHTNDTDNNGCSVRPFYFPISTTHATQNATLS